MSRVPSITRSVAAMVLLVVAICASGTSAAWADPSGKTVLLPLTLTPEQALSQCMKVIAPQDAKTLDRPCVGYYGDTRKNPQDQQNGKVPMSEKLVDEWYNQLIQSCNYQPGAGSSASCLASHTHWQIDKPLQENSWTWKCSSPRTLTDMASCFQEAVSRLVATSLTFWMSPKLSPQVAPQSDHGDHKGFHLVTWHVSSVVSTLQQSTRFLAIIVAALGIVVAGIKVAMTHRAQPLTQILQMFFIIAAVSGLAAVTTQIAVDWGDQFAPWVMKTTSAAGGVPGNFQDQWTSNFSAINQLAMLLVFGPFLMIAGLAQIMLMIVRDGGIFIMIGLLPLAAASTSFEAGKQWFKKICMWLLGLVLYKPAAAIIYGVGLMLMNRAGQVPDGTDSMTKKLVQMAAGMVVVLLAIVCLPAMVKLFAPIAAMGASAAFSGAGVAGAAVTGAVAATSVMTGGGALFAGAAAAAAQPPTGGADVPGSSPAGGFGEGLSGPGGGGDGGPAGPYLNGQSRPELESGGNRLPAGPSTSQVPSPRHADRALPTGEETAVGGGAPPSPPTDSGSPSTGPTTGSSTAGDSDVGTPVSEPPTSSGSAAWVASGTTVTAPPTRSGEGSSGGSSGEPSAAGSAPVVRQGRIEVVGAVRQVQNLSEHAVEAEE